MPLIGTSASQNIKSFLKPVATGGTLASDATYYYRTFTATADLIISGSSLTADVFMIGGGGAAANLGNVSEGDIGGAGAGGAVYGTEKSFSPSTYAVVVGAGGSTSGGTNGNDTTFNSIIAKGGGGTRFVSGLRVASSGGCGAGITEQNNPGNNISTQGSFSGYTSYGNRGGRPTQPPDSYSGGKIAGGGGIGGFIDYPGGDGEGTGGTQVNGGPGLNTWSTWATATGTGVGGFYGGGGGGRQGYTNSHGAGGAGGGGAGDGTTGFSGTANTGGGGGGTNSGNVFFARSGGAGGSGIFIIRYTKTQVD